MASLLRQFVAGPRAIHPEARLDLCYVTDSIIATSGPSQTYPQLAYRYPLDQLKAWLDGKHGDNWAIWEFRAEGTGYPDEAVDGRVRHYPWPDHHPPPFRLVPMIMASMRNWLHGGRLHVQPSSHGSGTAVRDDKRVVVVHCKAGKGRSGTITCSYLISEEGWTTQDALARFTQRRMRSGFGPGVSIPSQLRWVSYVDRWSRHGKRYVDRPVEITELHFWGLRSGVKVVVRGFAEDGKKIAEFHTFNKQERMVVEAGVPPKSGLGDMLWDLAGYSATGAGTADKVPDEVELADEANAASGETDERDPDRQGKGETAKHKLARKSNGLMQKVGNGIGRAKSKTASVRGSNTATATATATADSTDEAEPGGLAVVFRPSQPVRIPNGDVNVAVERRNKTHKRLNWTMVSAVAHVWFNAFFEGQGPEQQGRASDSGVFTIEWEAMDGIKGSSRKGARALDRMSVVWRVAEGAGADGEEILEPGEGEPVPQVAAADWKGTTGLEGGRSERDLGLRAQSQTSADVSRASSLKSAERADDAEDRAEGHGDTDGLRATGPGGEDLEPEKEGGNR
ncbi:hypothetical protein ED733_003000 [Metarhizium rileyi]|uniref:phosphatidylinositol-3,4,5-trisphosphate 3-phosphatase n=1 Tax=Metarhizium rileyi (strain RCEF 4871) TaxID=1649241 RepID=A0A5C6GKE5_METRR|nr:hypothetical protein ED733_003000 [Metarhizium rileyi]